MMGILDFGLGILDRGIDGDNRLIPGDELRVRSSGSRLDGSSVPGRLGVVFLLVAALLGPSGSLSAQQQFQGWCAPVKMEILQELTLERIGFEATLTITNNQGEDPITDVFAELTFEDPTLSAPGETNDASGLFFVRQPTMENINSANGDGVIGPTKTAVIRWFIIPKPSAGGTESFGKQYRVGVRLSGKLGGAEVPQDNMFVLPDTITVRPEPQLEISYFLPRDVQADDPFTPDVESPIPFTLGVLVKNTGFGIARDVQIKSEQPRIVENVQRLLLVAQLLGARVMDSPVDRASLTVNLGDINPGEAKKGAWDMITSLSGEFIEFRATYTHSSELGGEETSLIKSLEAHFFVAEVMNDQPGRDGLLDFLAVTDRNPELIPDALFESEGNVLPVNYLQDVDIVSSLGGDGSFTIRLHSDFEGWGYMRLDDPAEAKLPIGRVTRSDGKVLHPRNVWTNIRYEPGTNRKLTYLNILDLVDVDGVYDYVIEYAPPGLDEEPPETEILFAGEVSLEGDRYYVTRDTQIYFIAEDESPVSMFYSLNGGEFVPALPFSLSVPGEYLVTYYSRDVAGNEEEPETAVVVLPGEVPEQPGLAATRESFFLAGETLSVRPDSGEVVLTVEPSPVDVNAEIDVFQGVLAFPTLAGVPPSPTPFTAAELRVGGDHVDFYRYRIGAGTWSAERPAGEPIVLEGLSGAVSVQVLARSRYGDYPPEEDALRAGWTIDASAPPFVVSGAPATPTRSNAAVLEPGGEGISLYRWTLDDGFFRAEESLDEPLILTALDPGEREVALIGFYNGEWQSLDEPSRLRWTVDSLYGSEMTGLPLVYSESLPAVQGRTVPFEWDGRDAEGRFVPAGVYTVRVLLTDEIGRATVATSVIRIENLSEDTAVVAAAERAGRRPHARGGRVVWQDRATGVWNIVSRDLADPEGEPVAVTEGTLNQENPYTDGRYVVWQGRAGNGSWDVWMRDLDTGEPAERLTNASSFHDTNPVIEWPWVVFERRSVEDAASPRLLHIRNLLTGETGQVAPGTQDQRDPDIHAGRVVWQDHRHVGFEIYFADLETGEVRRITDSTFNQFHPKISGHWIVWQDTRDQDVNLYGFDLLRNREIQLTDTGHNETRPFVDGTWVVYEDDSVGPNLANVGMLSLENLRTVPLTNTASVKSLPVLASGRAVWEEAVAEGTEIRTAQLPAVQAIFVNNNTIPVSGDVADRYGDAFALLSDWNERAGVSSVTRYAAFGSGEMAAETASMTNGSPGGTNFPLESGGFLWVNFENDRRIADLGRRATNAIALDSGASALGYTGFPSGFHARALVDELGTENVRAIRMLDAHSGVWRTLEVSGDEMLGPNFSIPETGVVFVDLINPVSEWRPQ